MQALVTRTTSGQIAEQRRNGKRLGNPMMIAYIDPATGAMVMQIVAAAVIAGGVFFRKMLTAPLALFFKKGGDAESADGSEPSVDA